MSDDNELPDGEKNEEVKQEQQVSPTAELEAKIAKLQKDLDNARKSEKFAKSTKEELAARVAELEAQGEWKTKYEQAEEKLKNFALDTVLTKAAEAAKAKSIPAVLKLIDRSAIKVEDGVVDTKAVETAIANAKKDYGVLFEEVQLPAAGRAAEGDVTSGFQKEIRAAKSFKEIEEVMAKYNK